MKPVLIHTVSSCNERFLSFIYPDLSVLVQVSLSQRAILHLVAKLGQ